MTRISERSSHVQDQRLDVIRRRQQLEIRIAAPRCAVDGGVAEFEVSPSDVAILEVMLRERDPNGGGIGARTALAGLASLPDLRSAEVLVAALHDRDADPSVRAGALVALAQISPALAETLGAELADDEDPTLCLVAAKATRRRAPSETGVTRASRTSKRAPRRDDD
jgi:hypothetical protein